MISSSLANGIETFLKWQLSRKAPAIKRLAIAEITELHRYEALEKPFDMTLEIVVLMVAFSFILLLSFLISVESIS